MSDEQIVSRLIEILTSLEESGVEISPEEESMLLSLVQEIVQAIREKPSGIPNSVSMLWILAGGNEDAFVSYLRTFPDAQLNALARQPERLMPMIDRLSRQVSQSFGEVIDGVPKADLNSSNIFGFSYDPRSKKMFVKFQGNGNYGEGPVYEYNNVPPNVFKIFRDGAVPAKTNGKNKFGSWWRGKIPSLGASFWNLIRDKFPYQKVA